jgi:hypothetical protein
MPTPFGAALLSSEAKGRASRNGSHA